MSCKILERSNLRTPLFSAFRRCSFAKAGAIPSINAASLGLIPFRRASGFCASDEILANTYFYRGEISM